MDQTSNDVHKMLQYLIEKVEDLGIKIANIYTFGHPKEDINWLNIDELQQYLPSHPKKQTIYTWTSTRKIPFHKKGRSIMFDKDEIDAWLQDSEHIKSIDEIEREAQKFIKSKSK